MSNDSNDNSGRYNNVDWYCTTAVTSDDNIIGGLTCKNADSYLESLDPNLKENEGLIWALKTIKKWIVHNSKKHYHQGKICGF